jgi:RNA polymerase sigma-70 factor (ECF subfamily)
MADATQSAADFERLIGESRAGLHRYCARMVGSAFEGEDVVQDALAKVAEAWPTAGPIERPQGWLLRIAHNAALDHLRRRKRQAALAARLEAPDAAGGADARVAAAASLATLMRLSPTQRSCVVLIDVLGHSLDEALEVLGVTGAAAKAALHRGRLRLRALAAEDAPPPRLKPEEVQRLRAYADRFNARDFDALRALLAEDVRLDLVSRARLDGKQGVAIYFHRYAERDDWRMDVGLADGRLAILATDAADPDGPIRWVVLLDWADGQLAAIRDFFYARYVVETLSAQRL